MSTLADQAVLNAIFNPLLPNFAAPAIDVSNGHVEHMELDEVTLKVKQMEKQAIKLAEDGMYDDSIAAFTNAIAIKPNWASSYNNRAQAYRLAGRVEEAKLDLDKAIELTNGKGNVATNALCQRALIKHLDGQSEDALEDLQLAADQGHPLAKSFLVQLNPYAALCNQMLSQMINELTKSN